MRHRVLVLASLSLIPALFCGCNRPSEVGPVPVSQESEHGVRSHPDATSWFFTTAHQEGAAAEPRLVEVLWGRAVDVYGLDEATGLPEDEPRFRDLVVDPRVATSAEFRLGRDPVTSRSTLVVEQSALEADGRPSAAFLERVRRLAGELVTVDAEGVDASGAAPLSVVPRNATLVLVFDDLLNDGERARRELDVAVELEGARRKLFDPNHGGVVDGRFHSSRVLVELALRAGSGLTGVPDSVLRLPTVAAGSSRSLENRAGVAISGAGGPLDLTASTQPIVRAFATGTATQQNNGFLPDVDPPSIVGEWDATITSAIATNAGPSGGGTRFEATLDFPSVCKRSALVGDLVLVGGAFLEVLQATPLTGAASSELVDLELRSLVGVLDPSGLVGPARYLTTFESGLFSGQDLACWLSITPEPVAGTLSPDAVVSIRFDEPMDTSSIDGLERFYLVRGAPAPTAPAAEDIVLGEVGASFDLQRFTLTPTVELSASDVHLILDGGVSDLAGNTLAAPFPTVEFALVGMPVRETGSFVMRFEGPDELRFSDPGGPTAAGFDDLRGQILYDLAEGTLTPRPVTRRSYPADRNQPIPGAMIPFPVGTQTPLSPLGSKLQTVWRYCDLGFNVFDELLYNLDVEGLSWAPVGGSVVADYYEEFEIRLAHSNRLPDEVVSQFLLPIYPSSGLRGPGQDYALNVASHAGALSENEHPAQKVVHPRALGYTVNPVDVFVSSSQTVMMPFPLNRGGSESPTLYTWRDTTMSVRTAEDGGGLPTRIETGDASFDSGFGLYPGVEAGDYAPTGRVPSIGLPLLMEYRCYPSNTGVGLNGFDMSLAINSSARPNFRAYSTGGVDTMGQAVLKDPDLEVQPTGGFNPNSFPPGLPTVRVSENSFYIGQLDTVTRVSIAHTIWLDAGAPALWTEPALEPSPDDQPAGTTVRVDFRGADVIATSELGEAWNAEQLTPYGDLDLVSMNPNDGIDFSAATGAWSGDPSAFDGARYLQVRLAFLSNVETGETPRLEAFGIAFEHQ